jgi:hypothetical protein
MIHELRTLGYRIELIAHAATALEIFDPGSSGPGVTERQSLG